MNSASPSARPWPEELTLDSQTSVLNVRFDTGEAFAFEPEFLRVHSPSAEVRGHGGQKPNLPRGKQHVKIADVQTVGNYAVRLVFDDGHDTGLYSWDYLYELGRDKDALWRQYLDQLSAEGGTRN